MKKLVLLPMLLALLATTSAAMGAGGAQSVSTVQGHGKVQFAGNPLPNVSQINVNAWLDGAGVAHGSMGWVGGFVGKGSKAGPADPWDIAVTDITVNGNTATVCGIVAHSVFPSEIGLSQCFDFTDNSASGTPDTIDDVAIQAGNIILG
jgi:hypothetical protein